MPTVNFGKLRIVPKGDFDLGTEYSFFNGVRYQGSYYVYINRTASIGNIPTNITFWSLMSLKGDKGDTGDNIEIQVAGGYIQWKEVTGSTWYNLIALTALIGAKGDQGIQGVIYTPSVSAEGVLSFTNDGGLANPTAVNIKGDKGDPAPNTIWQYSTDSTTWTTVATGALYERQSGDNGVTWSEAHEYPGVAALALKANVTDVNDALGLKAPLASPTFTGDVVVPDQTAGNNSTKAANTKYADAKVADVIADGVTGIAPSQNAVYDALTIKEAIDNRTYGGVDLTTKFAAEIAGYADVWAWIKARITAVNYAGLNIGDYIPFSLGAETIWSQIAGIDTYYRTGDTAIGHHIDFISKDCMAATYKWNNTDTNNGSAVNASPWMVSALKASLDGLVTSLPAGLQAVIKEKRAFLETRYTSGSTLISSTGWAWNDMGKLWVPSEHEVYGTNIWGTARYSSGQSVQYPIFANSYKSRVKGTGHNGTRTNWWLASVIGGQSTLCCHVSLGGHPFYYVASTALRVPLCFRIG